MKTESTLTKSTTLSWRSGIHYGTSQFGMETPCMEVFPLMSGAKGEESHQEYKEGDGSHCEHVLIIILIWFV